MTDLGCFGLLIPGPLELLAQNSIEPAESRSPTGDRHGTERADVHPRPKVVILTNIAAPYRVQQFGRLCSGSRHEYLFYFCAVSEPNRQWRPPETYEFPHEFLHARPHTFLGGYSYFIPRFLFKLLCERPRAVIVCGFSLQLLLARVYGWLRGASVIVWSDSNILDEGRLPIWRTVLRRLLVRGIGGAIACSRLGMEYFGWLGVAKDRIAVSRYVNDAVSVRERAQSWLAARIGERYRLGLPGDALVLLFVGRLEAHKGVVELLNAFASVREEAGYDLRLLLVGDGPLRDSLGRMVAERHLSGSVTFAGFQSYEEMPRFYALADLVVVPSLREPYGLVVNEAIAVGIPVLCSRLVGARDLLEDGRRGVLFDPHDAREFRSSLSGAIRRVRDGEWEIPTEIPIEIRPETANATIEEFLERTIRRESGGVAITRSPV